MEDIVSHSSVFLYLDNLVSLKSYICPCCSKIYSHKHKKSYITHLKKHALKRIQIKKINRYTENFEDDIKNIFSDDVKSVSACVKKVIENYSLLFKYTLNLKTDYADEDRRRTKTDLSYFMNIYENDIILKREDITLVYHPALNIEWDTSKTDEDDLYTDIKSYSMGVSIHLKGHRKLPTSFSCHNKRKYIDIGNFKIYINLNKTPAGLHAVILFDPTLKNIAEAKIAYGE